MRRPSTCGRGEWPALRGGGPCRLTKRVPLAARPRRVSRSTWRAGHVGLSTWRVGCGGVPRERGAEETLCEEGRAGTV